MKVGFTFNQKRIGLQASDVEAEFDAPETIDAIADAIASGGHEVIRIEADDYSFDRIREHKDDLGIVFNIAEGKYGDARESLIPCILDHFMIPYTGSSASTLAVTLDKARTKEILSYHNILNAQFKRVKYPDSGSFHDAYFPLPAIVKPLGEGSSRGIRNNCLVKTKEELSDRVKEISSIYKQDVIVEEFLSGREFTVGILGNPGRVLPLVEIDFSRLPQGIEHFDSYEAKWEYDSPGNPVVEVICPARIDASLKEHIDKACLDAYHALKCYDFTRMDVRLDKNGKAHIIEVNALPGMIADPQENSRFPLAARTDGIDYNSMVLAILDSAVQRYKQLGHIFK